MSSFKALAKRVEKGWHTADGRNPANQLRLVVYPCLSHYLQGFYTSQEVQDFFHQQYYPVILGDYES